MLFLYVLTYLSVTIASLWLTPALCRAQILFRTFIKGSTIVMIIVSWFWMLADDLRNLYSSESSRLGMPIRWVAYVPIPCASVHGGHCHLSLSFFVLCRTRLKILLSMFDRQLLSSIAWTSSSPESMNLMWRMLPQENCIYLKMSFTIKSLWRNIQCVISAHL